MSEHLDRRRFLHTAALALGAAGGLPAAGWSQKPAESFPGLIIRQKEPVNLEFPFPSLDGIVTPTEQFYVRNHFARPKVDLKTWKLSVEGAVEKPQSLTFADFKEILSTNMSVTLECAGNSRIFLTPRALGVPWELGGVGTATWTGIPLAAVLARAGVKPGAVEVILEGADSGEVRDPPATPGVISYARSLPLEKAQKPETMLAWGMNGADLTPDHGYPLRAIVPGWYGMASVKWLTRIIVTDRPFLGYYQSLDYTYWRRVRDLPTLAPITEMNVKSQIARPMQNEAVKAGSEYRVFGAAWAGEADVTKVEVSTDGGQSWAGAKLTGQSVPFTWRLWEHTWKVSGQGGRLTLMARATDSRGRTQPARHDPDLRNYQIHHVLPVEVEVR